MRRLHLRDALLDAATQLDRLPRLGREVFGSPESARIVFEFLARDLELSVKEGATGSTLQDGTSITWTQPRVRIVIALVRELRARARGLPRKAQMKAEPRSRGDSDPRGREEP